MKVNNFELMVNSDSEIHQSAKVWGIFNEVIPKFEMQEGCSLNVEFAFLKVCFIIDSRDIFEATRFSSGLDQGVSNKSFISIDYKLQID